MGPLYRRLATARQWFLLASALRQALSATLALFLLRNLHRLSSYQRWDYLCLKSNPSQPGCQVPGWVVNT
jgi:hypothetical protein